MEKNHLLKWQRMMEDHLMMLPMTLGTSIYIEMNQLLLIFSMDNTRVQSNAQNVHVYLQLLTHLTHYFYLFPKLNKTLRLSLFPIKYRKDMVTIVLYWSSVKQITCLQCEIKSKVCMAKSQHLIWFLMFTTISLRTYLLIKLQCPMLGLEAVSAFSTKLPQHSKMKLAYLQLVTQPTITMV